MEKQIKAIEWLALFVYHEKLQIQSDSQLRSSLSSSAAHRNTNMIDAHTLRNF